MRKDLNLYNEILDWIYSFVNFEVVRDKSIVKKEFKLNKILTILNSLNSPHKKFKAIHIAGTKGKGSVAFIINNYLINKNYKVGLYTSPHIFEVRERIQINNKSIPYQKFIEIAEKIKLIVNTIEKPELKPTFFDILTSIAFQYFAEEKVDFAIIETGLGGRLDSTNVITPILSIITSISRDHTKILGESIEEISYEKAGIIKKGIPVVIAKNGNKALKVFIERAKELNSPYYILHENYKATHKRYYKYGNKVFSRLYIKRLTDNPDKGYNFVVDTSLLGNYQAENVALSMLAIEVLIKNNIIKFRELNNQYNLDNEYVFYKKLVEDFSFLKNIIWPARTSYYRFNEVDLIVDGAHNAESAGYLKKSIKRLLSNRIINAPIISIVGMMKDKEHGKILQNILSFSDLIIFIEPDLYKDCKVENYFNVFLKENKRFNNKKYIVLNDIDIRKVNVLKKAYELIKEKLGINSFTIVATGSLYTSALILKNLKGELYTDG